MKNTLTSIALAGTLALGLTGCNQKLRVEPIAFQDIDGDGRRDLVALMPSDYDSSTKGIYFMNGKDISFSWCSIDFHGKATFSDNLSARNITHISNSPLISKEEVRKGIDYSWRIENINKQKRTFDLHRYTAVDVEPAANQVIFTNLSY